MNETITISARVFSRNIINKQHWSQTRNQMKEYCLLVRNQMKLNKIEKVGLIAICKVHIEIGTKRVMDYDNMIGGAKQLTDSLWREGFMGDDSPKYTDLSYSHKKSKEYYVKITREVIDANHKIA